MCNQTLIVNRWFWRCNDCLSVVAIEHQTNLLKCGCCRGVMGLMGRVERDILVNDEIRCACDARCTSASGPKCNCHCGGVNHGTGKVVLVTVEAGSPPIATPRKDNAKHLTQAKEFRLARDLLSEELSDILQITSWLPHDVWARKVELQRAIYKANRSAVHVSRMKLLNSAKRKSNHD